MIFIKESYVHEFQWVGCNSGGCGYERCKDDSTIMDNQNKPILLRMFKVNGAQTCEGCVREAVKDMTDWLEDV